MFRAIDGNCYLSAEEATLVNKYYWFETEKAKHYLKAIGKIDINDEEKLNDILKNIIDELKNNSIPWEAFKYYYNIFKWYNDSKANIAGISDLAIGLISVDTICYLSAEQKMELHNYKELLKEYIYKYFHEDELYQKNNVLNKRAY